jgi:DNA modification methylase
MVMLRDARPRTPVAPTLHEVGAASVQGLWTGKVNGTTWTVHQGDARAVMANLPKESVHCIVTSPPYYWQRDYKVIGQVGLEKSIEQYVTTIADYMDEARRLLRKDGLLFLNLGDTYYSKKGKPKGKDRKNWARRFGLRAVDTSGLGVPRKTTIGIPWRVAIEMITRGWTLRCPIIWKREAPQPEPTAVDRPWRTYEMMFMFSRRPTYYFKRDALQGAEDIWTIPSQSKSTDRTLSAYFPEALVRRCLDVGCPAKGIVLDPFAGSGTVLRAALSGRRQAIGIDLNSESVSHMVEDLTRRGG